MKKLYVAAAGVVTVIALMILFIGSVAEDKTAPSFRVRSEDILYSAGCPDEILLAGVSATDDRDGNVSDHIVITNRSEVSEGKVEIVTFTVADSAGNVAEKDVVFVINEDGTFTLADYAAYSVDMDTLDISIEGIGVVGKATGNVIEPVTGDNNGDGSEEPSGEDQSSSDEPSSEEPSSEEPTTPEQTTPEPTTPEPTTPEPTTPEPSTTDEKPVMVLKNTQVTVSVGQNLTWANFYGKQVKEILDDKDSSNDLFKKITVLDDDVDTSTPGTYKVGYYCFDSDRNKSETVYLTVIVQ